MRITSILLFVIVIILIFYFFHSYLYSNKIRGGDNDIDDLIPEKLKESYYDEEEKIKNLYKEHIDARGLMKGLTSSYENSVYRNELFSPNGCDLIIKDNGNAAYESWIKKRSDNESNNITTDKIDNNENRMLDYIEISDDISIDKKKTNEEVEKEVNLNNTFKPTNKTIIKNNNKAIMKKPKQNELQQYEQWLADLKQRVNTLKSLQNNKMDKNRKKIQRNQLNKEIANLEKQIKAFENKFPTIKTGKKKGGDELFDYSLSDDYSYDESISEYSDFE